MIWAKLGFIACNTNSLTTTTADIVFVADKDPSFDFFTFSQQWPITRCILLAEKNKRHACSMESAGAQRWTIFGIWPTRIETKSPAFCSKKKPLQMNQLEPFINELNEHWFNVQNDTSIMSFWQYEWNKHGTCCTETKLETEANFFLQGLTWSQEYSMIKILASDGIMPGKNYKVIDIHNAVFKKLNKIPSIHCDSTKNGDNYFIEIRLCFSKTLALIDCHVTDNSEVVYKDVSTVKEVITNCNLHKDIIYPVGFPQIEYDGKFVANYSWLQVGFQKIMNMLKQSFV